MRCVLLVLLVLSGFCACVRAEVDVPITVTDHAGVARSAWPVSGGVPFPRGYLRTDAFDRLVLTDAAGRVVPSFQPPVVLGRWPDGSVRWALLDFAADVDANGKTVYRLKATAAPVPRKGPAVTVVETPERYVVDTGVLRATIDRRKFAFLEDVRVDTNGDGRYDGHERITSGPGEMFVDLDAEAPGPRDGGIDEYTKGDKQYFGMEGGNWLRDSKASSSTRYAASAGEYRCSVFRRGRMHTVLRMEGFHKSAAGRPFAKYTLYLHFYAGQPFVRVLHTWIMTGNPEKNFIRRMGIRVPLAFRPEDYAFGGEFERYNDGVITRHASGVIAGSMSSRGETYLLSVGPDKYYHNMPARSKRLAGRAVDAPPWKDLRVDYTVVVDGHKVAEGYEPSGWGDFTNGRLGFAVGVRDFYREHPKEIQYKNRTATVYLWPDHGGKTLDLRRYATQSRPAGPQGGKRARRVNGPPGSAVGMAKTTELLFYFHEGDQHAAKVDATFAAFDEPLVPFVSPAWNCATGVLGPLAPRDAAKHPELENFIDISFHWITLSQREFSWYGMLDWGDALLEYSSQHWELPNWPSNRGRYANWGYAGWSSEWDPGLWMLVQYFRSGRYEHFRYGEAKVRHNRDVDCVYYEKPDDGPLPDDNHGHRRLGGGHRHHQQHWGTYLTGYAQPNISNGLLYWLTGEGRCLDAYRAIAGYHAYAPSIENEGRLTLAVIGDVLGEKKWIDIARDKLEHARDCRPSNVAFGRGCVANMMALMLWDIASDDPVVRKKLIAWGDALEPVQKQGSEATIVLWAYIRSVEKRDRWDAKIRAARKRILPVNNDFFKPDALPDGVWKLPLDETLKRYFGSKSPVALFAVYKPPGFFPIPCLAWALDDIK